MKTTWNDFAALLEALQSGDAARELAKKESWIKDMIGQANAVKSQASQNKADLEAISATKKSLSERAEVLVAGETQLKAARDALTQAQIEHKKEISDAHKDLEAREAKMKELESKAAALEERANQNFTRAQEKLDHLEAAINA